MAKKPSTNAVVLRGQIGPITKKADKALFQIITAEKGKITCVVNDKYLLENLDKMVGDLPTNPQGRKEGTIYGRFKPVHKKDHGKYIDELYVNVERIYNDGIFATFVGRLTKDARVYNGDVFGTLAVDDGLDKAGKETCSFIEACFGKKEKLAPYLKKGQMLSLEGTIRTGEDRYFFNVTKISFIGGSSKSSGGKNAANQQQYAGDPFSTDPVAVSHDSAMDYGLGGDFGNPDTLLDIASDDLPF